MENIDQKGSEDKLKGEGDKPSNRPLSGGVKYAKDIMKLASEPHVKEHTASGIITDNFSEEDKQSALAKLSNAAMKYDRTMPGTVQPDAFECDCMDVHEFKLQIKKVFNLKLNKREFSALCRQLDPLGSGVISCNEFMVLFLRKGFEERSRHRAEILEKERKAQEEMEKKRIEQLLQKSKGWNAVPLDLSHTEADKTEALSKLRVAAKAYKKGSTSSQSLDSFEYEKMSPTEFRDELRRLFSLKLTPPQLGALVKIFDLNGDGFVTCNEFLKCFLQMGFMERSKDMRLEVEKQRAFEEAQANEAARKKEELDKKNALKVGHKFSDADRDSAMAKLVDAAWRYDKNLPGSPSTAAFEAEFLEPHIFREQLRSVFGMKINLKELSALCSMFDKESIGLISCTNFMVTFVKLGSKEKFRRRQLYRQYELQKEEERLIQEENKKKSLEQKNSLKIEYKFTEDEFSRALAKITAAAMLYDRNMPGCVPLTAFECESMLPHIFKEQLKLVLGVKVTPPELGALMSMYDKDGSGVLPCSRFLVHFIRVGVEERSRIRREYREVVLKKEEEVKKQEITRLENELKRQENEMDTNFLEEHFDSALKKLIEMCYMFDSRTLGPGGWRAFESATLNPGQFREMLKRTFNVRLSSQELGALVAYYSNNTPGVVECPYFINNFIQMRIKMDTFKGRPDEEYCLEKFFQYLKESYKLRIEKKKAEIDRGEAGKPWRAASVLAKQSKALRNRKNMKKPYPLLPEEKLKCRLLMGKLTSVMDLSCKVCWKAELGMESESESDEEEGEGNNEATMRENELSPEDIAIRPIRELMANMGMIETDFKKPHPDGPEAGKPSKNPFDIKLGLVPREIFSMKGLRELWLCNNAIHVLPPEIGELKQLKLISIKNCASVRLPEEICTLSNLRTCYFQKNKLKLLPAAFGRLGLTHLDLGYNEFTSLPPEVCNLQSLIFLSIAFNSISTLPDEFIKLKSLLMLDCSFSDISAIGVPDCLLRMNHVYHVGVDKDTCLNPHTHMVIANADGTNREEPHSPTEKNKKTFIDVLAEVSGGKKGSYPRPVQLIPISHDERVELVSFIKNKAQARAKRKLLEEAKEAKAKLKKNAP